MTLSLTAKSYLLEGYTHVVDMDLSKFFDRVNHDRLMSRLATKIRDKRVLKLIRRYLTAGTMIGGLVSPGTEGTPQGGPLSPLLSNIVLDELDKELEKRGHKFVRYADDFRIYCKSRKAAERVNRSITKFVTVKLKLKVNEEKKCSESAVATQIPGLYLHQYVWPDQDPDSPEDNIALHGQSPGIDGSQQREKPGPDHKGAESIPHRMVELLPPDGSEVYIQIPESLDRSQAAVPCLETVEEPEDQGPKSGKAWNFSSGCHAMRERP